MKLPVSEHKLETNITNSIDVVIGQEESSKILTFLRDNIYQAPKTALVKELVSNALDVHVENNITRPIEITLPNMFSNLLIIRDFGTGLSPEFMSNKYTQVGFSTKEDKEESLGAYGIGRLSPLAYTDVYYIDSYFEGTLYKYILSVYDEGFKKKVSLLNLGEFTTEEPSGFKVSIPIKEEDYSIIEGIVREHCRYLHNQPPLINGESAKVVPKVLEGNGWYITYAFENYIIGLIGGMPNKIRNISDYINISYSNNYSYNQLGLVINIPIGSVNQTASKDIQKTKFTEATLTELFKNVKTEIISVYQSKLNSIDNLVEAIQLVVPLNSTNHLNWKGINLTTYSRLEIKGCDIKEVSYHSKSNKYQFKDKNNYLPFSKYIKVYINDLEGENQKILAEKVNNKLSGNTYIISNIKTENFNDLYNFPYLSSIISKNELVAPPKTKKQSTVKKKVDMSCVTAYELRYDANLQTYCSTNKVRVPKDPDRTEYYLELTDSNKQLICNNAYYNKQTQHTKIYLFEDISKLNLDVWVDFNVYLKQKIDGLLEKTPKLLEVVDLLENHINLWDILCCFKDIDNCDLKEFYDEVYGIYYIYYFVMSSEEVNLLRLETYNQVKLNEVKLDNSLLKEYHRMESKYPLIFKYFARNNHLYKSKGYRDINTELTVEEVNNYIQLVNK
jgi:hypothetical protein